MCVYECKVHVSQRGDVDGGGLLLLLLFLLLLLLLAVVAITLYEQSKLHMPRMYVCMYG